MKKRDFADGICDNCGNTGLAGEKCLTCGGVLTKIEPDSSDPLLNDHLSVQKEPEVYSLEALEKAEEDDDYLKND